MANGFAYAKLPNYSYQTFNRQSVQFTNIPLAARKKPDKDDDQASEDVPADGEGPQAVNNNAEEGSDSIDSGEKNETAPQEEVQVDVPAVPDPSEAQENETPASDAEPTSNSAALDANPNESSPTDSNAATATTIEDTDHEAQNADVVSTPSASEDNATSTGEHIVEEEAAPADSVAETAKEPSSPPVSLSEGCTQGHNDEAATEVSSEKEVEERSLSSNKSDAVSVPTKEQETTSEPSGAPEISASPGLSLPPNEDSESSSKTPNNPENASDITPIPVAQDENVKAQGGDEKPPKAEPTTTKNKTKSKRVTLAPLPQSTSKSNTAKQSKSSKSAKSKPSKSKGKGKSEKKKTQPLTQEIAVVTTEQTSDTTKIAATEPVLEVQEHQQQQDCTASVETIDTCPATTATLEIPEAEMESGLKDESEDKHVQESASQPGLETEQEPAANIREPESEAKPKQKPEAAEPEPKDPEAVHPEHKEPDGETGSDIGVESKVTIKQQSEPEATQEPETKTESESEHILGDKLESEAKQELKLLTDSEPDVRTASEEQSQAEKGSEVEIKQDSVVEPESEVKQQQESALQAKQECEVKAIHHTSEPDDATKNQSEQAPEAETRPKASEPTGKGSEEVAPEALETENAESITSKEVESFQQKTADTTQDEKCENITPTEEVPEVAAGNEAPPNETIPDTADTVSTESPKSNSDNVINSSSEGSAQLSDGGGVTVMKPESEADDSSPASVCSSGNVTSMVQAQSLADLDIPGPSSDPANELEEGKKFMGAAENGVEEGGISESSEGDNICSIPSDPEATGATNNPINPGADTVSNQQQVVNGTGGDDSQATGAIATPHEGEEKDTNLLAAKKEISDITGEECMTRPSSTSAKETQPTTTEVDVKFAGGSDTGDPCDPIAEDMPKHAQLSNNGSEGDPSAPQSSSNALPELANTTAPHGLEGSLSTMLTGPRDDNPTEPISGDNQETGISNEVCVENNLAEAVDSSSSTVHADTNDHDSSPHTADNGSQKAVTASSETENTSGGPESNHSDSLPQAESLDQPADDMQAIEQVTVTNPPTVDTINGSCTDHVSTGPSVSASSMEPGLQSDPVEATIVEQSTIDEEPMAAVAASDLLDSAASGNVHEGGTETKPVAPSETTREEDKTITVGTDSAVIDLKANDALSITDSGPTLTDNVTEEPVTEDVAAIRQDNMPPSNPEKRRRHRRSSGWNKERMESKSSEKSGDRSHTSGGKRRTHHGKRTSTTKKVDGHDPTMHKSLTDSEPINIEPDSKASALLGSKKPEMQRPPLGHRRRDSSPGKDRVSEKVPRPKLFDGKRAQSDTRFTLWDSSKAHEKSRYTNDGSSRHKDNPTAKADRAPKHRKGEHRSSHESSKVEKDKPSEIDKDHESHRSDIERIIRKEERRKEKQQDRAESEEAELVRRRRGERRRTTEHHKSKLANFEPDDRIPTTDQYSTGNDDTKRRRHHQHRPEPSKMTIKSKAIEGLKRLFA